MNPGSIVQIWAGNCNGRWKCLWNGKPNKVGHQPRQFGPPIEPPSFHVSQLRIHFEGSDLPYHAAIDAVCLLGKISVNHLLQKSTTFFKIISGTIAPPSYALEVGSILYRVLDMNLHLELVSLESLHEDDHENNASDNGYFDFVPREAMLQIFQVVHFFVKSQLDNK